MTAEWILMWLLLGGVAFGCVWVLLPFWSALLWAGILVFTTWPMFTWFRHHLHLKRGWAAGLMVLLTAVVLVLPLAVAAPNSAEDVTALRQVAMGWMRAGLPDAPQWVFEIPLIGPTVADLLNHWAADISAMLEAMRPYYGVVVEGSFNLLLGVANGVLMFILALFIAFFFYVYGDAIATRLQQILYRIAGAQADRLIRVTGATVRGVVYGILGTAVVQGFLTAFGLWISGVPRPVLLATVAGLLAVLPVGAPLVWIPASLWLMTTGHLGWGIFLAAYGAGVISGADSLIRPWFIARGAQLPFLLTILGVLGGAIGFGFLGIFLGPVLLGIGFTLINEWASAGQRPPPVSIGVED